MRMKPNSSSAIAFFVLALSATMFCARLAAQTPDSDWYAYGHDAGGTRYSPLTQINRSNVHQLKPAWTYHTGALQPASDLNKKATFESTPILVEDKLYLSTAFDQVIALDPATGKELWK